MKELEDHKWFPNTLRNFQTEYIGFVVKTFNVYMPFVKTLPSKQGKSMVDLCSGSGEPAISIFTDSNGFSDLTLTDKYPVSHFKNGETIRYLQEPMDVLNMVFEPGKTYTMFNAFHHFNAEEQRRICAKIKEANARAYFVEILFPSPLHLIKTLFATTVGVVVLSPFIKPFSWVRILFTYFIPINILTISIDGFISVMKSKTVKQYQSILNMEGIKVFEIKKLLAPLLIIQINESN